MATSDNLTAVILKVVTGDHIPSFKNTKRCGHTPKQIKQRMMQLENRIVSNLYSWFQTQKSGTETEWLLQLRTFLSGLSDDSIKQICSGTWEARYVEPGCEGVEIEIERLT